MLICYMQDAQVRALLPESWRNQPTTTPTQQRGSRLLPGLKDGLAKVTMARAKGLHQGRRVTVQMGRGRGKVQVSLLRWHWVRSVQLQHVISSSNTKMPSTREKKLNVGKEVSRHFTKSHWFKAEWLLVNVLNIFLKIFKNQDMSGSQKMVVNNNPTIISDLLTEFQSTAQRNPEHGWRTLQLKAVSIPNA